MSDNDQVWNAFITAMPAQDQARHDLHAFQSKLLKSSLQQIEDQTLEIISLGAQIVKLTELLNEVNAICKGAIEDRDRFRDDWKAMAKDLSRWRPA